MDRYTPAKLNSLYSAPSRSYAVEPQSPEDEDAMDWSKVTPVYKETILDSDKALLEEMLESSPASDTDLTDLAGQVFGRQALQEKLGLKQLLRLLHERYQMHVRHMNAIRHRNGSCQEQLSVARFTSAADGGKMALSLERMLQELESNERREEVDFWKDTSELRQKILENAAEYAATRRRADWLGKLEENDYNSEL